MAGLEQVSGVPEGTLKAWLRPKLSAGKCASPSLPSTTAGTGASAGSQDAEPPRVPVEAGGIGQEMTHTEPEEPQRPPWEQEGPAAEMIRGTHLQLVVTLWLSWKGPFSAFCHMVRTDHRVPHSDTFIGNFLEAVGLRSRRHRIPVEAPWSSETFRTFFPGAQWLGDGTTLAIRWRDEFFTFNVEVVLDAATNAILGIHVSDTENKEAVIHAYRAGLATAGAPPLALTLDNKPGNHTDAVQSVVEGVLLAATAGRGQAKAPLEGTFGLFQQEMPPLVLVGQTVRELMRSSLELIFTAWARGRNGRPRKRLDGLSPAEAYASACPTPKQVQDAKAWIRELLRRQELARRTREARLDPIRVQLLTKGLEELGIPDPKHKLAVSLAVYAREAIVRGLAVFQAKQGIGGLPPHADLDRYLGGIIRRLADRLELEHTAIHLLKQRIRLRDLSLEPLIRAAEGIRSRLSATDHPSAFVDRALDATFTVDFRFWAMAAADALAALSPAVRRAQYQNLCLRISVSFHSERERRVDLIDRLAEVAALAA